MLLLTVLLACGGGVAAEPAVVGEKSPLVGEAPSSLAVDPAQLLWEAEGMRLETQHWRVGSEEGEVWRVAFPRSATLKIAASDHVKPFSEFYPSAEIATWAMVNGGFYEDNRAMGLVVSGGVETSPLTPTGGSGILQAGPEGLAVVHRDAWKAGPTEAVQSIDRLVDGGVSLVKHRANAPLAARSAVVLSKDYVWLVVAASHSSITAVDGGVQLQHTSGYGMSLADFAEYLTTQTGAQTALNLDGAVSTQLAVVAPGQRFEVRGELGTINGVMLVP